MSMPSPVNKLPAKKDPEARAKREAEYAAEMAERQRKLRMTMAKIEPIEDDADLGTFRSGTSLAISAKRIADTLDQILMELRAMNQKARQ